MDVRIIHDKTTEQNGSLFQLEIPQDETWMIQRLIVVSRHGGMIFVSSGRVDERYSAAFVRDVFEMNPLTPLFTGMLRGYATRDYQQPIMLPGGSHFTVDLQGKVEDPAGNGTDVTAQIAVYRNAS